MKNILTLFILTAGLVLASCNWDDFGDLNVNPNQATTPRTSALFTNAMLSAGGTILSTTGALYVQQIANKQYTSGDNYQDVNFSTDGWYNGPLADLQKVIELNTDEATKGSVLVDGSNANQIAVAKIMMSYYYLHMTDRWGDLPYSEALKGGTEGLLQPKFDPQEDIFNGIFQNLKDAHDMIDGGAAVKGDIILNGNMNMWKKFANTIRMTAALRLSQRFPNAGQLAANEFADAFADGVIDHVNNTENIRYRYLNVQTYENPFYNSFQTQGRSDWTVADPMMNWLQINTYTSPHTGSVGKMNVVADPRLPVYANPIENTTNVYIGMPYGLTEAAAGGVPNSQVSFLGNAMRQQTTPAMIYTSAQVAFTLAEGRFRGWITTGTVQGYYETGIEASLKQHGVGSGYAQYITNSEVVFDSNKALEQIITQKWIANFLNGYETWAEWRRTGFPTLQPAENALTPNGQIPTRQAYGTTEAALNPDNYQEALTRQGLTQDDLTGKVWWDQ